MTAFAQLIIPASAGSIVLDGNPPQWYSANRSLTWAARRMITTQRLPRLHKENF
jgi:hypothetical protein